MHSTQMFKEVRFGEDILKSARGILVHGCNGTTLPAGGLAHQVFSKYPRAEIIHDRSITDEGHGLGNISIYQADDELYIVNAITQLLPGSGSLSYDAVHECFDKVNDFANILGACGNPLPILLPKIGAGIAGGNWNIISTIIHETIDPQHHTILFTF
jgi:O-acetyl-ADP-ribose deacetylase (regulator of RNase III)